MPIKPEDAKFDNAKWQREAYAKDPERYKEYTRKHRSKYPERNARYAREWAAKNPEKIKQMNQNRSANLTYRISNRMRVRIWEALKGNKKGMKWTCLVKYNAQTLKAHLVETIPTGYGWDDFMMGRLHIDHIRPISSFQFQSYKDPEFQKCWDLNNLRFLPAQENMTKGSKIQ